VSQCELLADGERTRRIRSALRPGCRRPLFWYGVLSAVDGRNRQLSTTAFGASDRAPLFDLRAPQGS
jgi:hypothetical protein